MFHDLLFMQPGNSKCSSVYENCLEQSRAMGRYNCPFPSAHPYSFKSCSSVQPLHLNTSWRRQVCMTKRNTSAVDFPHFVRPECHLCVIQKAHCSPSTTLLFYLMVFFTASAVWRLWLEGYFLCSKLKGVLLQRSDTLICEN